MIDQIAVPILAYIFVQFLVVLLVPVARRIGLVEHAGKRKKHQGKIPLVGGISIFFGILATNYFMGNIDDSVQLILLVCSVIVIMGSLDDRYDLSALLRLFIQIIVASLSVYLFDIAIIDLGHLMGFGHLSLGWAGYPLTILFLVVIINAINMLDGIDGLVGILSGLSFFVLSVLFSASNLVNLELFCLSILGAIIAFLIFNLWGSHQNPLAKIFMGDAGSMSLGLCLGIFLLLGVNEKHASFNLMTALWFVLLPITDICATIYGRLRRGHSPMRADRTHIHHRLMSAGLSKEQTLGFIVINQALFIVYGVYQWNANIPAWVSLLLAIFMLLMYRPVIKRFCIYLVWKRRYGDMKSSLTKRLFN